jgi:hypothetical protein
MVKLKNNIVFEAQQLAQKTFDDFFLRLDKKSNKWHVEQTGYMLIVSPGHDVLAKKCNSRENTVCIGLKIIFYSVYREKKIAPVILKYYPFQCDLCQKNPRPTGC